MDFRALGPDIRVSSEILAGVGPLATVYRDDLPMASAGLFA